MKDTCPECGAPTQSEPSSIGSRNDRVIYHFDKVAAAGAMIADMRALMQDVLDAHARLRAAINAARKANDGQDGH